MDRESVLSTLRAHATESKAAGITRLLVFGSVARDEATEKSDVDVLVDIDPNQNRSLLTYGHLQQTLCDLLQTPVDLSTPDWLKASLRDRVLREAVLAF